MEVFVAEGRFPNRSEAIRVAIRDLIKKEYLLEEIIMKKMKKSTHKPEIEPRIK